MTVLKIRNEDEKRKGLNLRVLPSPIIQRRIRILKKLWNYRETKDFFKKKSFSAPINEDNEEATK